MILFRSYRLLFLFLSLILLVPAVHSQAQESPVEVVYLTPEQLPAFLAEQQSALVPLQAGPLTVQDLVMFQLHLLNMNPQIINSRWAMFVFTYTAATAFYLTIGAERLGVGFTYVAQNFFIAAATIATVVAIRFDLAALGITNGTPWPASALMRLYFHWAQQPSPTPPPQFQQYDLPVGQIDDDASNEYGDPTGNEPPLSQPTPEPNLSSPVTSMTHFGCSVPNIDLSNTDNPPVPGGYAGDRNACGPAAAANSLKWLESLYPNINIPFTHRALLDSLSRLMGRQPGGGVSIETFVRGKLDFIQRHNLPIQVKFQGQGVTGNISATSGPSFARNDNTGPYPTWQWLKQEVADTEDVEIFYKWFDGTNWRGHAVTVTGVYETMSGKKYIGLKHDLKQRDTGGTVQEFPEITVDGAGRMIVHRSGIPRYISHVISESPGPPFITGVRGEGSVPFEFRLEQNYPNPFNPSTEIRYQMSEVRYVELKVFDVLGQEVTTLVDEVKHVGKHSVLFDAGNLPSGVYFYRLTAGSYVETKRMLLLK